MSKFRDDNRIIVSQEQTTRKRKKDGTAFRQTLFDAILVVENLFILIIAYFTFPDEMPVGLLIFIAFSQYFGIGLKTIYYSKFHIWSNSLTLDSSMKQSKEALRNVMTRIKSIGKGRTRDNPTSTRNFIHGTY